MTKKAIQKKLIECNEELDKIARILQEVREMDQTNNYKGYRETALEIARNAERFTCKIRGLVSDTIYYNKREFMLGLSENQGITINQEESWLKIVMPLLLPKKKMSQSCAFVIEPLNFALKHFVEETKIPRISRCVVCFRNIYADEGKVIKDHDNIETKRILDILDIYLMVDDSGRLCSNFYRSEKGDIERTEIFIIPNDEFEKWLKSYPI